MSMDVIDVIYKMRNMCGKQADGLRGEIQKAQDLLDKLESFADGFEGAAEAAAKSDKFPNYNCNPKGEVYE